MRRNYGGGYSEVGKHHAINARRFYDLGVARVAARDSALQRLVLDLLALPDRPRLAGEEVVK